MSWDLITELFDYDFLKSNPSVVQSALNTYLKHQELYSVKISVLKFLIKVCDALIVNCDIFRELEEESFENETGGYLGSVTEEISIKTLL